MVAHQKKKLHCLDFSGVLVTANNSTKSSKSTSSYLSLCKQVPDPPLKPFFPRVVSCDLFGGQRE